ncbi:MAG: hypothetical protein M1814_006517 [Vezdaea aestivalis]|nr:MAG: hypothetical protein M1814_006517 [Vezdaea aestivalis]
MAQPSHQLTPLFGGAITTSLPTRFIDSSELRTVPDHQEVYLDREGLSSLTIEILEYVRRPAEETAARGADEAALQYHIDDIIDETDNARVLAVEPAVVLGIPNVPTLKASILVTPKPTANGIEQKASAPDFTVLEVVLIRLAAQETDLLVVANVPHVKGEYTPEEVDIEAGRRGGLWEAGLANLEAAVSGLVVKDWSLFGNGEEVKE